MEHPMNIVILRGVLSRPPEERELPSGDRIVTYEVTVAAPDGRSETVPVVWSPPASGGWWDAGQVVVVTGRVRRRFFRAGGATQSRTEVVAERVVRGGDARRARRAVEQALAAAQSP
jgi:single-strand DNA-binding protein